MFWPLCCAQAACDYCEREHVHVLLVCMLGEMAAALVLRHLNLIVKITNLVAFVITQWLLGF